MAYVFFLAPLSVARPFCGFIFIASCILFVFRLRFIFSFHPCG